MKILKSIAIGLAAIAALGGFTACQDDFDNLNVLAKVPEAELTPNTSILEFKQAFWQDGVENYATQVGTKADGSHYIVSGRVITSDYAGNIYKSLVIQDETAALQFSINAYSLYQKYRYGQEIVIDLTGLYAGKYMGLFQVGAKGQNSSGTEQTTYMSDARFYSLAQLNGLPEPSKVNIRTLENMSEPAADNIRWQSELVRFNNVTAEPQESNLNDEGLFKPVYTFGIYHENFDQVVKIDGTGYKLRTSGYSNFYYELMPTEPFDLQALLSYYNGDWQLYIVNYSDVMNAGNPTIPAGSEKNPWSIDQAIENITAGATAYGWTKGYIVGTVAPEVTEITSSSDIEWGAEATLANTVVIAPFPECTDYKSCLIVPLPQNSVMRNTVALKNNPGNLGKELAVQGTPDMYMGTFGITGNLGTAGEFKLEGVDLSGKGDGTEARPYNCAQIIAMNPSSTTAAVESGVWVRGYIVGYYEDYEAHFQTSTTQRANILISDVLNPTDKAQTVCVQLLASTPARNALNLVDNPGNLGKQVELLGDVMKYNTLPGIKNTTSYKLNGQEGGGDTPTPGQALFSQTFKESQGDFTIHNVELSPSLSYVWSHDASYGYMKASAFLGQSYASSSWLVSPLLDLTAAQNPTLTFDHVTNKFPDIATAKQQVSLAISVDGGDWQTVAIPNWSTNADWTFVNAGTIDLAAYAGKKIKVGFHYTSTDGVSGSWEIKNFAINGTGSVTATPDSTFPGGGDTPGGGDEPVTPPAGDFKGDFDTFNGGEPKSSPYGTYTNATGWTAEGSIILGGQTAGVADANPRFGFIGGPTTLAVCLNGKTSAPGKLTSPQLTGGIKTLTFKYGTAYSTSASKFSFTVKVLQNGAVVKEETLTPDMTIKTAYDASIDVNVTGDFTIEIVNNCPSEQDKNLDRVAIWNLTWD